MHQKEKKRKEKLTFFVLEVVFSLQNLSHNSSCLYLSTQNQNQDFAMLFRNPLLLPISFYNDIFQKRKKIKFYIFCGSAVADVLRDYSLKIFD